MDQEARRILAAAIVEAIETGNPIAPIPAGLGPADAPTAEAIAEEVLDTLGQPPCGLRCVFGAAGAMGLGPVLASRLLRDGATLPLSALRQARVSAAAIGVLAEPLDPDGEGPPALAAIHPALDVATSRFRDGPANPWEEAADLGGLGFVVAGRRGAMPVEALAASCAVEPQRPRGTPVDMTAAFAAAAAAARRLGGLPAGGLLVLAGLTSPARPGAGETWVARLSGRGRARAHFAASPAP
mgnify:CR=1 FL=1